MLTGPLAGAPAVRQTRQYGYSAEEDGERRSFNPYFGFRTGYAHAPHQSLFPLGGVVGVELLKSEVLLFSLEARAYGLIGRKEGPDFALEPGFGLNVAY